MDHGPDQRLEQPITEETPLVGSEYTQDDTSSPPGKDLISQGGRGTYTRDIELIRQAVKNDWAVSDEIKKSLPSRLSHIAMHADDDRSSVNAAKVLVAMDKANIDRHKPEKEQPTTQVNVNVNVDNRPILDAAARDQRVNALGIAIRERCGVDGTRKAISTSEDPVLSAQSDTEASGVSSS